MAQPGPSDYRSQIRNGMHERAEGIMDQVSDLGARAETMAEELVAAVKERPYTTLAIAVSVKEHEEEVAEHKAEQADTGEVASDATAQAMVQAPLALLGALISSPGGAAGAFKVARVLGRNLPLVLLRVMIGALFWPTESQDAKVSAEGAEDGPAEHTSAEPRPNGFRPADTFH